VAAPGGRTAITTLVSPVTRGHQCQPSPRCIGTRSHARGRRAWASRYRCGPCRSPSRAVWRTPRAGGSSGPLTRCHRPWPGLPGSGQPTEGGHGHVRAASRSPPYSPARSGSPSTAGCGRPPEGPTAGSFPRWRSRSPGRDPAWVRTSEADQTRRRWLLGPISLPDVRLKRACAQPWSNTSITRDGNQGRVLGPVQCPLQWTPAALTGVSAGHRW
jgi:hypothetical protein